MVVEAEPVLEVEKKICILVKGKTWLVFLSEYRQAKHDYFQQFANRFGVGDVLRLAQQFGNFY